VKRWTSHRPKERWIAQPPSDTMMVVTDSGGLVCGVCFPGTKKAVQRARLIAAAPDLLAAAKETEVRLRALLVRGDICSGDIREWLRRDL